MRSWILCLKEAWGRESLEVIRSMRIKWEWSIVGGVGDYEQRKYGRGEESNEHNDHDFNENSIERYLYFDRLAQSDVSLFILQWFPRLVPRPVSSTNDNLGLDPFSSDD
jgi:hypothetical protein